MTQRTHFDLPRGRLEARVNLPQARPMVLLCGDEGEAPMETTRELHALGYGTVGWAYRGASPRDDERDLVDLAVELRRADLAPFGLGILGHGMGGFFATRAVVSRPDLADFLVLQAPIVTLRQRPAEDAVRREYREGEEPLSLATHVRPPTLVVHGARDAVVPLEDALRFASALHAPHDFVTLDADHVFAGQHAALARAIEHFVASRELARRPR